MLSAPTLLGAYVNHNRPGLRETLPEAFFPKGKEAVLSRP